MKGHNYGRSDLARKYRIKHGEEMPTLKLARIMYKDNPAMFRDVEDARHVLRYIEGKDGDLKRKNAKMEKAPDRPRNPYSLPQSDETSYEPYRIEAKRVLILSDVHIPYHSVDAITACLDYAKNEKPDAIVLNGDTIDFFQLSRFTKDPAKRSFAGELTAFRQFFEVLRQVFPEAAIYFKHGNHEERYQHFLWTKAGELDGVDEFRLDEIIKARAEGIQVVGEKRIIKLGDLNVIHGHEFGQSIFSPVNIARGLFLRGKVSALQGHHHMTSEHTETDMNRNITTTFSVGCLCELFPSYLPINRWNHGFAICDLDGDKFHVRNYRIHKGEVL